MPDVFLTRRQILGAKIETTYGTYSDPNPANSYEAIRLVDPFTYEPGQDFAEVTGGSLSRGYMRPIATTRPAGVTFRTYVHGITSPASGVIYSANAKPPIGDLLRACGYQELFETAGYAGGRYRYRQTADPSSDNAVSLLCHEDGFDHRLQGGRGNVNWIYLGATPVIAEFAFRAIQGTEAATIRAAPANLPTIVPPRWIGSGSIFVESLHAVVNNFNLATGNTIYEQPASIADSASGIIQCVITDRRPTGSMDPEVTNASTLDFFGQWRATSGAVLRLQTNVTTGNRFTTTASQMVVKTLGRGDATGMRLFNVGFEAYERNVDDTHEVLFD